MSTLDALIVGAGPTGLAAALEAEELGLDYLVLDKGGVTNAIFRFPTHMVFFTTPELLEIGNLPMVCEREKPTRLEALKYYRRVVQISGIRVHQYEEVQRVAQGAGAFRVSTTRSEYATRNLVLATGYYDTPNMLGVPGENLPHVSHYYTEAHPHFDRNVVVVGGQNSAAEAALELYRAGARVTLVHRGEQLGKSLKYWVRPDIENRIKEGSIASRFECRVVEIRPTAVVIECEGQREELPAEAVLLLTGYHPDVEFMTRAGITCDPETLAPTLDAETFETNVPNLFVAGGAIAGRHTGNIFIENGRFHGERIVEVLAERRLQEA